VPEKPEKKNNYSPAGKKAGELWREVFMEEMSFEPGVEDRRSDRWWSGTKDDELVWVRDQMAEIRTDDLEVREVYLEVDCRDS